MDIARVWTAGGLSIIGRKEWTQGDCYTLTSFTFACADSPHDFIRQKIRIEQKQSLLGLIEAAADLYRRSRALTTLYKQPLQLQNTDFTLISKNIYELM